MRHHLFAGIALTLALVAGSWVSRPGASAAITAAALRKAAPDFTLSNSTGAPVRLSDYRGHVLLLDFWATWCTGCKVEIPWFMEFQEKYVEEGLSVIGVALDADGWTQVRPYVDAHPFNYPVVVGNVDFAKLYGITSLPITLLIDRDGMIADTHLGIVDKDGWEEEIRMLLQETPSSIAGARSRPWRSRNTPSASGGVHLEDSSYMPNTTPAAHRATVPHR
jgi:cytochrome c biogenesis protein CcmG/thiol:disulfide interchange protein DsbE